MTKRNRDYRAEYQARIAKAKSAGEKQGLTGESLERFARGVGRGHHPGEVRTARTPEQVLADLQLKSETDAIRHDLRTKAGQLRADLLKAALKNAEEEGREVNKRALNKEIGDLLKQRNKYIETFKKAALRKNISVVDLGKWRERSRQQRKQNFEAKMRLSELTGNNHAMNARIWRYTA